MKLKTAEIHRVGPPNNSEKEFNEYRNTVISELYGEGSVFKRKMTQGAYWVAFDSDLAIQFFRDERWLLGIKFWDALKLIDHGIEEKDKVGNQNRGKKPGFINT